MASQMRWALMLVKVANDSSRMDRREAIAEGDEGFGVMGAAP
jgi:hypothetical protein